ncbi:MAG: type II toxin-antitoxin system HipA family toxin [Deltaproteobacteria bacterium]
MDGVTELSVWVDDESAGRLSRQDGRRYVFNYSTESADAAVSLTMPVRLESWVIPELHPIFQMNLPEGALLAAIRQAIAKVIGDDDLSILRVTGGNQVGRNHFSLPEAAAPGLVESPESLEDLLSYPDTTELFHELISRYALRSGISGVQPKVMLDATQRGTIASAGYIVKSWGTDYPQLAANEFFCMSAVKLAGLPVPEFHLSDNGGLFVMKRFDVNPVDSRPLGFEDMCALQGVGASRKYGSTYERVARSIRDFVSDSHLMAARKQFFAMLALSVMVRNGDAHLKNFGVLYPSPSAQVTLAPVYDVITTTAYIRQDVPALSLSGAKKWWPRKMLEQFAITHLSLPVKTIGEIVERVADAVMQTRLLIPHYIDDHPEFREIGARMTAIWRDGVDESRNPG